MTDPSEEPMYPPEKAQLQAGLLHGCRRCLLFDEKTSENPNRKDTGEGPCCMDHLEGYLIIVFFNTGDNLDAT